MDDPNNKTPEQLAAEADNKAKIDQAAVDKAKVDKKAEAAAKAAPPVEEEKAVDEESQVRQEVNRNTPRIDDDGNKHWE